MDSNFKLTCKRNSENEQCKNGDGARATVGGMDISVFCIDNVKEGALGRVILHELGHSCWLPAGHSKIYKEKEGLRPISSEGLPFPGGQADDE
ncbi:MAG: hypothetical protein OEV92_10620 [Nitrospinota bacterium]|nr:hypothetical protein [Nitrospinota bacterium]